ncbi:hypothetical protein [Sphingobium baderi]|uniref:C-type lysozyme inhibitor domain-containing protein n=1 Tax=Sphingobium baderi TaxID=1332080 RepID=A0A0S3EXK4_9SPHN|nr:hypothetical protein [Sphingobium baderi]ALR20175.1 hypothetical protein ATN00_07530 [Sphingobium baderi]
MPKGGYLSGGKPRRVLLQTFVFFTLSACHNIDDGGRSDEGRDHESMSHYVPPSVARTIRYRCDDGSEISVDVFDDNQTLFLRDVAGFAKLKAEREGAPFSGNGITFMVTRGTGILNRPGAKAVRCKS